MNVIRHAKRLRMTSSDTDFQVLAFFMADHAVVESGKLYVNGGFGLGVGVHALPATVPVSVAAALRVPARAYLQDHTLSIRLLDADGGTLPLVIDANFRVSSNPSMRPGDPTTLPIALTIPLAVERAGDYSFVLSVDGTELDRYPFRVIQQMSLIPQLPGPASTGGPSGDV